MANAPLMTDESSRRSSGPFILIVDDDPKIVRLVRGYLEESGFRVEAAGDGEEALHAIRTRRPDLVVLDLMLPKRDGYAVTQAVRSDPALQETPILMLTARVDDVDRILGLELGADDYVTKPFNPREVTARVKAILRRTNATHANAEGREQILQIGTLTLDLTAHTVQQAGQSLALTPSEFDILALFMRNPGRALTRTQIIEEGLGYEYAGLERTVDSHIKNLRRKLEADPQQPQLLETVFGVGYRLNRDG